MNFPPEHMTRLYDSVRAIHSTLEPEAALRGGSGAGGSGSSKVKFTGLTQNSQVDPAV